MTHEIIPEPTMLREKDGIFSVDSPIKVRKAIERAFEEVGKYAYKGASFDIAKWSFVMVAIGLFIHGTIFGPIGVAIAVLIGVGGYLSMDKLMESRLLEPYLNKPRHALALVADGKFNEAVSCYSDMMNFFKKARKYIKKIDSLPETVKKFILDQLGHEVSENDFNVYESTIHYAVGVIHEAQRNEASALDSYKKAFLCYSGNIPAIRRLAVFSARDIEKKSIIQLLTSANNAVARDSDTRIAILEAIFHAVAFDLDDKNITTNLAEATAKEMKLRYEELGRHDLSYKLQKYIETFHDIENMGSLREKTRKYRENDAATAALLACLIFEEKVKALNGLLKNPVAEGTSNFLQMLISGASKEKIISKERVSKLNYLRSLRNGLVHPNGEKMSDKGLRDFVDEVLAL